MTEEKQLSICLAEYVFVHDQMHQRMSVISTLVSLSATFLIAAVGFVYSDFSSASHHEYSAGIALVAFVFWGVGLLIYREDDLNLSHDLYLRTDLKPILFDLCRVADEDRKIMLQFLETMERQKIVLFSSFLSGCRYGFCVVGLGFCFYTVGRVSLWSFSWPMFFSLLVIGAMFISLVGLLLLLGQKAKESYS